MWPPDLICKHNIICQNAKYICFHDLYVFAPPICSWNPWKILKTDTNTLGSVNKLRSIIVRKLCSVFSCKVENRTEKKNLMGWQWLSQVWDKPSDVIRETYLWLKKNVACRQQNRWIFSLSNCDCVISVC